MWSFLSFGYDSFAYIIGITSGFCFAYNFNSTLSKKNGVFIYSTFFEKRFNSKLLKITTIIIVVLVSFIYISAQLKGVGIIFSRIFQLDLSTALLIGMCITLFYAFIGGMKILLILKLLNILLFFFFIYDTYFFLNY